MEKEEESVRVNSPVRPAARPRALRCPRRRPSGDPHKMAAIFSAPPTLVAGRAFPAPPPASTPGRRGPAEPPWRPPADPCRWYVGPGEVEGPKGTKGSRDRAAGSHFVVFLGWAWCIRRGDRLGGGGGAAGRAPRGPACRPLRAPLGGAPGPPRPPAPGAQLLGTGRASASPRTGNGAPRGRTWSLGGREGRLSSRKTRLPRVCCSWHLGVRPQCSRLGGTSATNSDFLFCLPLILEHMLQACKALHVIYF
ncbi:PREDICTED: translation initiation factor IF-2-like [Chinchilla lanigera]|uniref:translation initiation factor IF-2-like n=1 Tax=Chinchilla lanigera TaxID=34839 RepID=UPI000697DAAD|nr:PREDICTED: translation initiation factor IF-2-like [Chinchilla lanigera]